LRLRRREISPYRLYLTLESGTAFLLGISYATVTVYWVTIGRLNPLQLLLLGTALEGSYFLFQLPTGLLADLISRRLCVLAGLFVVGAAQIMASLSASFVTLLLAWAVLGFGAALNNGAQDAWIADELSADLGDHPMTGVYLRATQLGLIATVAGSLLSGVIALAGLEVPLRVGGGLICALAAAAALVMPERHFHRPPTMARAGSIVRQSVAALAEQTRSTRRAVVAVPGLVLLFTMTLFTGLWSESFDRLWGAFLLRDIRFPDLAGMHPAMWFGVLAAVAAVLGLSATEVAKRRTERLGPDSGWMVGRIGPAVRATALSARDMFDSGGQILGGPVVGLIGTFASIRIALLVGAAALAPAAACVAAASRRITPRAAAAIAEADAADATPTGG